MQQKMLDELVGCRLESVRISKGSYSLEFEKMEDSARSHFDLSTNGWIEDERGQQLGLAAGAEQAISMLERYLGTVRAYPEQDKLVLQFSGDKKLTFSTNGLDSAEIALVQNRLTGDWCTVS